MLMHIKDYFESRNGIGVFSSADADGVVDAAIYAKPHATSDGRLAFLMRENLTYENSRENPSATYLFIEDVKGYSGLRLHLEKEGEEQDDKLIEEMTRSWISQKKDQELGPKHLVYYRVVKMRKLTGDQEPGITLQR